MLTKDDLQAIQKVVKDEVQNNLKIELDPIKRDLTYIKKDVRRLRKDLNVTISTFDSEITDTRHRVDRIEKHLDLPPIQIN